ncbi:uncharacterized protein LOC135826224 [Sycon ciliatum]|uniref:uncharacterized protein LOC135826224 n=1 Tax=Sycon ciliatum TaxID=27933 RepID=UPI0031F63B82
MAETKSSLSVASDESLQGTDQVGADVGLADEQQVPRSGGSSSIQQSEGTVKDFGVSDIDDEEQEYDDEEPAFSEECLRTMKINAKANFTNIRRRLLTRIVNGEGIGDDDLGYLEHAYSGAAGVVGDLLGLCSGDGDLSKRRKLVAELEELEEKYSAAVNRALEEATYSASVGGRFGAGHGLGYSQYSTARYSAPMMTPDHLTEVGAERSDFGQLGARSMLYSGSAGSGLVESGMKTSPSSLSALAFHESQGVTSPLRVPTPSTASTSSADQTSNGSASAPVTGSGGSSVSVASANDGTASSTMPGAVSQPTKRSSVSNTTLGTAQLTKKSVQFSQSHQSTASTQSRLRPAVSVLLPPRTVPAAGGAAGSASTVVPAVTVPNTSMAPQPTGSSSSHMYQPPLTGERPLAADIGPWASMKKITIPTFDGDKRRFESWWAAFSTCVDKAPLTAECKMLRLRQYVQGEPLKAIDRFGYTIAAYDAAKALLHRKYGGERRRVAIHLEEIEALKPVRKEHPRDLELFSELLAVAVINLKDSGRATELAAGTFYLTLLKKLDEQLITRYHRWRHEQAKAESVEELLEYCTQEAEFMVSAAETKAGLIPVSKAEPSQPTKVHRSPRPSTFVTSSQPAAKSQKCIVCQGEHKLWQCLSFKAATVNKRWRIAKDSGVCFRCLDVGHNGCDCTRSRPCGLDGCTKLHHRFLHATQSRGPVFSSVTRPSTQAPAANSVSGRRAGRAMPNTASTQQSSSQTEQQTFCSVVTEGSPSTEEECYASQSTHVTISLRTIPVTIKHGDTSIHVNALLDDGSTMSYISEGVAHELGLHGELQSITVNTLDGTPSTFQSVHVSCSVASVNGMFSTDLHAWTVRHPTGRLKPVNWHRGASTWPHLKGIRFPPTAKPDRVDVLLGLDCVAAHQSLHEVTGKPGEPVARLTPLGWTCVGPVRASPGSSRMGHAYHAQLQLGGNEISQLLRRFWDVEELAVPDLPHLSPAEEKLLTKTRESLAFSDGRYHVGLPWKTTPPVLPDNFAMARKRLIGTERKLLLTDGLGTKYSAIIQEYLAKGYIRRVPKEEPRPHSIWYLPHFPVVRLDKQTTKVRIVFDGSAQFQGVGVNDFLNKGPKLQRDICDVLLRFRKHPVAIACDIKQMYLQIGVHKSDRPYQRFLWRNCDSDAQPAVYEFQRVVFGLASSPFLAQFVSQEHARVLTSTDERAAEAVNKSTYMDDTLDSVPTVADGIALYKSLVKVWESAGMHPTKWLSNSTELLAVIPESEHGRSIDLSPGELPRVKTLGISWSAASDAFSFAIPPDSGQEFSKRRVLQRVASVFDPLGLLAPYIIRGKMLIQELWLRGSTWDDPLEPSVDKLVKEWIADARDLQTLRIPRPLMAADGVSSLHVFADASEKAMGAVAYIISKDPSGATCRLVAAKSKVAPLEEVSIPRLELIAAVMAARLAAVVSLALEMQDIYLWYDSMNVLWWIHGHSRQFKTFVANRVSEIRRLTQPEQWRHVTTDQNPADLVSRGCTAAVLTSSDLWWTGPAFLSTDEPWPASPTLQPSSGARQEVKGLPRNRSQDMQTYHADVQSANDAPPEQDWIIDPAKWLDWQKTIRTLTWVRRFISNCRAAAEDRLAGELTPIELADAELYVVRNTQRDAFAAEIVLLRKRKAVHATSKLAKLCPFLDDDGVLRCEGRLQYAEFLPRDAVHPIILPRKHAVTKMLIRFQHEKGKHAAGTNATLSALAARYWVIAAREAVHEWEQECAVCRRYRSKPAGQRMAPLPVSRIVPSHRAFSRVGVDYAGPFLTMQGRGRARTKRYLCVFTCLETRAVHLELAFSLDTSSFINCFFRFVSRRGLPNQVISDNGTNFVGAVRELKDLIRNIDQTKIQTGTAHHGVSWSFNPPAAPHFGGVFEIMVKAAKRAIYHILSGSDITDEDLLTAFAGAEDLINSRPITAISVNPNDNLPLTPNHFLNGRLGEVVLPESDHPRQRWQRIQELLGHVWRRWIQEWLPQLSKRVKWTADQRNVKVGDVMLLLSPDTARRKWPLARVLEVYPGKDERVRVAKVQVGDRTLVRPINRLCPLEYASE